MTGRRTLRLATALFVTPLLLAACDLLMTEPAAPSGVTISFQVGEAPVGGTAEAFSKVRRIFLTFVREDATRDTMVAALPVNGLVRASISLPPSERVDSLGIVARLGFGTTTLFTGTTEVEVVPGAPTVAQVLLVPVPDRIEADRPTLTLIGPGASSQLSSAVLYATGDTIENGVGVWTSEDPTIVAVSPVGLAIAQRIGQTRLEVRADTLADTVLVDVAPPPSRVRTWASAGGGDWYEPSNWSGGAVPTAGDSVLITLDGTYTVTAGAAPGALAALSVGGAGGAQTLALGGGPMSVTGDVSITGTGSLELTGTTLTAGAVLVGATSALTVRANTTISAPISNNGLLAMDEGLATISGPLTTTASSTLRVSDDVFVTDLTVSTGFTNNGLIELGGSSRLTVSGGPLVNAAPATIAAVTTALGGGRSLEVALDNRGSVTLAENLSLDLANAVHTNSGTITTGTGATLFVIGADAFDNPGTLDASNGIVDLAFSGTGSGFSTSGSVIVGSGAQIDVQNGPFAQTAGSITGGGTFRLTSLTGSMAGAITLGATGPTFLQLLASSLTAPSITVPTATNMVLQDGSTVTSAVTIQGVVAAIGAGTSTIDGAVITSATSQISVAGGPLGSPILAFTNGFTNDGSILLQNTQAGESSGISVAGGPLVNGVGGSINAIAGSGGSRTLTAELDNRGLIASGWRLDIDAAGASHTNSGTMSTSSVQPIVVTGADAFDNSGTLDAGSGDIDISLSGSGAGFTSSGTLIAGAGRALIVQNGPFAVTAGGMGGAGELRLVGLTGSLPGPVTLGTTGPDGVVLSGSTLTAPGLTTASGTTLTLDASTLNAPLTSQGQLRVLGNGASAITGAVTTTATSTISVEGSGGGTTALTVANGFTNNGSLSLTNLAAGDNALLTITTGGLTNSATGTLSALAGAGGGTRTLAADLTTVGSVALTAPLTVVGQLIDPVGAPSSYAGNGSPLTVAGLDVDGGLFDNTPLVSSGGALTTFANVTFQNMDATATQLSITHPGAALPFTATNLTFSTPPTTGFYVSVTDSDALSPLLTFEVLSSTPVSGLAQSVTSGGATLIW